MSPTPPDEPTSSFTPLLTAARRTPRAGVALAASLAILGATAGARADEPLAAEPPPAALGAPAGPARADTPEATANEKRWYGWQLLLPDAVGLGALTAGGIVAAARNGGVGAGFFYTGFVVSNFDGPFVHLFHGVSRKHVNEHVENVSLASLGLRVGLPIAGLAIGFGIGSRVGPCPPNAVTSPCQTGMIAGTIAGEHVAVLVDDAFLAWDRPVGAATPRAHARWAPAFLPVPGGGAAGIAGRF
jgi:hypothetical protein